MDMVYYKVKHWRQNSTEFFDNKDNFYEKKGLLVDDGHTEVSNCFSSIENAVKVLEHLVSDYSENSDFPNEVINVELSKNSRFSYGCVESFDGDVCLAYREFWIDEVTVADGLGRWSEIINPSDVGGGE